jgi:hypothetical protein
MALALFEACSEYAVLISARDPPRSGRPASTAFSLGERTLR